MLVYVSSAFEDVCVGDFFCFDTEKNTTGNQSRTLARMNKTNKQVVFFQ